MFITKFLPFAVPAYLICLHMILCYNEAVGSKKDITTNHTLYNRCSENFVEVRNRRIEAKGSQTSHYTMLELETQINGAFTIKGIKAGRFICIDRRGKIKPKVKWSNPECLFNEYDEGGYAVFSFADPKYKNWTLGFKKSGKPIAVCNKGQRHCKHRECHQFMKMNKTETKADQTYKPSNNSPRFDSDQLLQASKKHQQDSQPKDSRSMKMKPKDGKRRRRSRTTTLRPNTASPEVPLPGNAPGVPLVRFERDNEQILRTLRLLKLVRWGV